MEAGVNNFLENSVSLNQQSNNDLLSVLRGYDFLIQRYGKEIVESALKSLEIIGKFLGNPLNIKTPNITENICKNLLTYQNKDEYISYLNKGFGSDAAALTYSFAENIQGDKISSLLGNSKGIYDCLSKYLSRDSKCADLFCGGQSGRYSSIYGTALIFSLFGINKVLAVDLFNQDNEITPFKWDYYFGKEKYGISVKDIIPLENIKEFDEFNNSSGKCESFTLNFDIFGVKMDAYDSLKSMPDNSLDAIMINNVDYDIVQDATYEELLRPEIKRVVKNKGLVFGSCTTMWPKDANYISKEKYFTAFENNK